MENITKEVCIVMVEKEEKIIIEICIVLVDDTVVINIVGRAISLL